LEAELIRLTTPRTNEFIREWPHPKQAAFLLLNDIREVLFGGATGGGKSSALLMAALQYVDVPGYAALILRTTSQALTLPDGLVPRSQEWLAESDAKWNEQRKTWTFPSGATLTFGYLESPRDKYRYASSAYQFIGFEELTEFRREEDYTFLFSRLRKPQHGPVSAVPLRMRATTNPVGPGFSWVKRRFVDTPNTPTRVFLPSTLDDNPSLDAAAYMEALEELGPAVAEQLRHGIWKAVAKGEVFDGEDFVIIQRAPLLDGEVRYWDLASTQPSETNPDPDWTVGVRMGLDSKGNPTIVDVVRDRLGPDGVEDLVLETARRDGKAVKVRMPQDPGQAGKAQILTYSKILRGFDFDGVRESGDKVVRAGPLSAQVRRGACSLVAGSWIHPFIETLEGFPGILHDDDVDAASGAYNFLMGVKPPLTIKPGLKQIRR
jgi:predicted phage terminase large subunit-like protein